MERRALASHPDREDVADLKRGGREQQVPQKAAAQPTSFPELVEGVEEVAFQGVSQSPCPRALGSFYVIVNRLSTLSRHLGRLGVFTDFLSSM